MTDPQEHQSQFYLRTAIQEAVIMKNKKLYRGRAMQILLLQKNLMASRITGVAGISAAG